MNHLATGLEQAVFLAEGTTASGRLRKLAEESLLICRMNHLKPRITEALLEGKPMDFTPPRIGISAIARYVSMKNPYGRCLGNDFEPVLLPDDLQVARPLMQQQGLNHHLRQLHQSSALGDCQMPCFAVNHAQRAQPFAFRHH